MGKRSVALIFPGQGSFYVGMGKGLCDRFPTAKKVMDAAAEKSDFDLLGLCFEGPEETLRLTRHQQPCLFMVSCACYFVFKEQFSATIHSVAGHSVGEYAALVAASVLDFEDALALVNIRAEIMHQSSLASSASSGAMLALLGRPSLDAAGLCEAVSTENEACWPANFNCPGQIVISGHTAALNKAKERAAEFGVVRSIFLDVSAPFHSPLMEPAAKEFSKAAEKTTFHSPRIKVFSNATGRAHSTDPEVIKENMVRQIPSAVRFEAMIREMAEQLGDGFFLECGPKKVLSGIVGKIVPGVKIRNLGEPEDIAPLAEILP